MKGRYRHDCILEQQGDFYIVPNWYEEGHRYEEGQLYLHAMLPVNDEHHNQIAIPVKQGSPEGTGHGPWGWNGQHETCTLVPSIRTSKVVGYNADESPIMQEVWHGHLVNGEFIPC